MKIRTDFVTNSSSSSYIAFTIDNPILAEFFQSHDFPFVEVNGSLVTETDNYPENGVPGYALSDNSLFDWIRDFMMKHEYEMDSNAFSELLDAYSSLEEEIDSSFRKAHITLQNIFTDSTGSKAYDYILKDGMATCSFIGEDMEIDGIDISKKINEEGFNTDLLGLLDEYGKTKAWKMTSENKLSSFQEIENYIPVHDENISEKFESELKNRIDELSDSEIQRILLEGYDIDCEEEEPDDYDYETWKEVLADEIIMDPSIGDLVLADDNPYIEKLNLLLSP